MVITVHRTQRDMAVKALNFHGLRASAYLTLMLASNSVDDFAHWKSQALKHLTDGCQNPFAVPDEPFEVPKVKP